MNINLKNALTPIGVDAFVIGGMVLKLYVQSSISRNMPQVEAAKDFQRHDVAHKFAAELAKLIEDDKDCVISETSDEAMITTRYEIHVFSPEQLRRLMYDIEGKVRRGLPIIL